MKSVTAFLSVVLLVGWFDVSPAHPQGEANGVIHACVHNVTGNVRIVAADISCKDNESLIQWNSQGPTGPPGPTGNGGINVLDADNNVLGTLIGLHNSGPGPNGVVIFKDGYFINVLFSGKFPVGLGTGQLFWTNPTNCSGNVYLNDLSAQGGIVMGTKIVIYSGQSNALYVPSGSGASVASTATGPVQFGEVAGTGGGPAPDGSSVCGDFLKPSVQHGWLLTPFDPSMILGWTVSGNPLGVAGPIKFE